LAFNQNAEKESRSFNTKPQHLKMIEIETINNKTKKIPL